MSDPNTNRTYVRETRTTENNGVGMALIVGGLVVAVGFVLWFLFGAFVPTSTTPADGDTNVTIEAPAEAPADPAPEAVPVDPAPADPAPEAAPVDPATPAPTDN